jgi:hypothetical protein
MFGSLSRRDWFASLFTGVCGLTYSRADAQPAAPAPDPAPGSPLITTTCYDLHQPLRGSRDGYCTRVTYDMSQAGPPTEPAQADPLRYVALGRDVGP